MSLYVQVSVKMARVQLLLLDVSLGTAMREPRFADLLAGLDREAVAAQHSHRPQLLDLAESLCEEGTALLESGSVYYAEASEREGLASQFEGLRSLAARLRSEVG